MMKKKLTSYTQVHRRVFGYIIDRPSQAAALRIFARAGYNLKTEAKKRIFHSIRAKPVSQNSKMATLTYFRRGI